MTAKDAARACRVEARRTCCPDLAAVLLDAAHLLEQAATVPACKVCNDRAAATAGMCMRCYQRHRAATRNT